MTKISQRHIKAWQRFNDDLNAYIFESEDNSTTAEATLYEDAYTSRSVRDFVMTPSGQLSWIEEGKLKENIVRLFSEELEKYLDNVF